MMIQQYYCRGEERGSDHCNIIVPGLVNHDLGCQTVETYIHIRYECQEAGWMGWDGMRWDVIRRKISSQTCMWVVLITQSSARGDGGCFCC